MRIAYFVWEFPPKILGGLGTYAMEVTDQLQRMGHDVVVFTLNYEGEFKTREVFPNGVEVHRPKITDCSTVTPLFFGEGIRKWGAGAIRFFSDLLCYNVITATKLVHSVAEKKKFDVIVAHDWLSAIGGMIAKRELGLPYVLHIHSTEHGRSQGKPSGVIQDIEMTAAKEADLIVTVSYAMRDELGGLDFPGEKVRVIWNAVDASKYDPARFSDGERAEVRRRLGVEDDEQLIFFIGRLSTVKGPDALVRAMPTLLREFPGAKLNIMGLGEQQRDLEMLVKRQGLDEHVILEYKFIPESERILRYLAADVVVFPSKYEPFGIVCTEAMAMERPVVVGGTGTSGLREQIMPSGPNHCGFHINPHDPSDIAWGVGECLRDPERARELGKNGRKRVLQYFTWEQAAKDTLELYLSLVPGNDKKDAE